MKKKIIFAIATSFFAVATVLNINVFQENSVGDVSLDAIAVMAQAQTEVPGDDDDDDNGCSSCGAYEVMDCRWTIFYIRFDSSGNKQLLGTTRGSCKNCAYTCDSEKSGNCSSPKLCPRSGEVIV